MLESSTEVVLKRPTPTNAWRPAQPWCTLLLIALGASSGGCCGIASYFCGPDKSRWVAHDYRTPESALDTFLEAIRRDDTTTIAEGLSEDAKRHYGLTGIFETTLAWERLRKEVPGIHMLGSAKVPPLERTADDQRQVTLRIAGQDILVRLVEQPFWVVYYRVEGEPGLERDGRYVSAATFRNLLIVRSDLETTVDARVSAASLPTLRPGEVRELRLGHDWKVDRLDVLPGR